MSNKKSILNDQRWLKLAVRYRNNRIRFAVEIMGYKPTWQQRKILNAMDREGAKVSVSSGHGTGKSFIAGVICMHLMLCHVKPEGILTANNVEQVRRIIFKYLTEAWADICRRIPWIRRYFTITSELFYCNEYKKSWYVAGKTVPKQKPEGIAGAHNKNLLYIVDEASSAEDDVLSIIKGALSEDNNKLLLFSQPTRNSGEFYDSHHGMKKLDPDNPNDPGYYEAITLNSEESPLVSIKALRDYVKGYGGCDTPEYQIKVKGQFSDQLEGFLISRRIVDIAKLSKVELNSQFGYIIVADIGGGVERDSSVIGVFKVSGYDTMQDRAVEPIYVKEMPKTMSAKDVGKEVYQIAQDYHNVIAAIDSVGIGLTAAQEAEELGVNVQRITWGVPPHSESQKKRFLNQRALAYVALRDAIMTNRIRIDSSSRATDEISRIPYKLDERGRYQMRSKEEMRKMGIPSPDWADVYAMAMIADFIPSGDAINNVLGDTEHEDYIDQLLQAAQ